MVALPLGPPLPIQTYAVIARFALSLTVLALGLLLSTLDFPAFAGPKNSYSTIFEKLRGDVDGLPAAVAASFLRLRTARLLWSRHGDDVWCCRVS